jgi:hypothetical protein
VWGFFLPQIAGAFVSRQSSVVSKDIGAYD